MPTAPEDIARDTWVWVMVQNPGKAEQVFGLHDDEQNLSFIPFFLDKETALQCFINLPRNTGVKYEAQAFLFEDLLKMAEKNGFLLYLLNAEGGIQKKITPGA